VCGIAGIFDPARSTRGEQLTDSLTRMTGALAHRGPDDDGLWIDAPAGVALGHRRLAVLDLSRAGHQPMVSASGRYVISYNGELYNFTRLRPLLECAGVAFVGHSDTEILLAGIEAWGVPEMLDRCNGMFAFALWDRREHTLTLARDRLGEKPLYYGRAGPHVVFASELRAIRRHPLLVERIDRAALAAYLRYGYVPAPGSIVEGIAKLGPGELLTIRPGESDRLRPTPYWSLADAARAGRDSRRAAQADVDELQAQLHELLRDSVRLRLAADVPLGAFLSGGIDSSTLVALMRHEGGGRVRTFSIGFENPAFDEAGHAAAVAAHLETEHTQLRLSAREALAEVPRLSATCDEPFADPALLPTLLVARLARQHVTVAFAGDGGDELFGGYPRYRWAELLRKSVGWMPTGARRGLAAAACHIPPWPGNRLGELFGSTPHQLAGDRLLKLAELASPRARGEHLHDPERLYERLVSCWLDPPVRDAGTGVNPIFGSVAQALPAGDPHARMKLVDSLTYLPDDILTKVDRATMAVSLEARVPLLDHRVVELAWRMAPSHTSANGLDKRPLREILYRYVPRELVDRPKRGFEVPLAEWLRGPLRPWAEELLEPGRLAAQGQLDSAIVTRHWREHLSGQRNWHRRLWPVLMYQAWLTDSRQPPLVAATGRQTS
jgi:asparagine synthase (glutamine-hydrolysing)